MMDPTQKSFFKALFDFSFKSYITPKIIRIIFGIVIVISAIGALFLAAASFEANAAVGAVVLIVIAPIVFLFYVIMYRVMLEVVMAVFTIAENTTRMVGGTGPTSHPGGAPGSASASWSVPPTSPR
jgi:hypothetical protein